MHASAKVVTRVAASVAPAAALLPACSEFALGPRAGPLEFLVFDVGVVEREADYAPFPIAELRVDLLAVNEGHEPLRVEFACPSTTLEAFRGDPEPVWRSVARKSWPHSICSVCGSHPLVVTLRPGDTQPIERRVRLADILADSLPAGAYTFEARVETNLGAALVPLGPVALPPSRFPLPENRIYRDAFEYAVEVTGGPVVRTTLVVTHGGRTSQRLRRTLSATCPVRILAHETPEDRETIPVPPPIWTRPVSCPDDPVEVELEPGETRTFDLAWEAAGILASGVPEGRYALTAVVDADGRPLRFAVGEVELRR